MDLLPARIPRHLRGAPTPRRAARFVSRWVRGTTSLAVRYPLEVVPPWRRELVEGVADAAPPDLDRPHPGDEQTIARAADGVGPLFHRRYWIDLHGSQHTPRQVMARLLDDVNLAAPTRIGPFEHVDGTPARDLSVGDEVLVRLPGPWQAPVRVVERTPTSFRLVTLQGHIEAGEIEFRVTHAPDRESLRFEIESWARSSAVVLHLLYDVVPVAREAQLVMWARMCRSVARVAGGHAHDGVQVRTERLPWPPDEELR